MKIVINPLYAQYADFVRSLPAIYDRQGRRIYKARNEIKIFDVQGVRLVVKKFKVPVLFNRIAYSFFRPTKAQRAYENALEVLARGFETPAPVAYLEERCGGLLSDSYFISLECTYPTTLYHFEFIQKLTADDRKTLREIGKLNARLHESGILHLDFSPGNILYEKQGEQYRLSLLDINRMKFCPVSRTEGCRSFRRLRASEEAFGVMVEAYAEERGFDTEQCLPLSLRYNREHVISYNRKKKWKQKWRKR